MNDKRIGFFLIAAVLCAVMTPLAPSGFRWVPVATSITYVVLAIVVTLDVLARRARGRRE